VNGPAKQRKGAAKRGKNALEGSARFSFLKRCKKEKPAKLNNSLKRQLQIRNQ
jgi:hypothetical protein